VDHLGSGQLIVSGSRAVHQDNLKFMASRVFLVFKDFINTKNTLQQMKLVQCDFGLSSASACLLSCRTVTKMIIQFTVYQS